MRMLDEPQCEQEGRLCERPPPRHGGPELGLRELPFELETHAPGNILDRVGVAQQIVVSHVEREDGAVTECPDPPLVSPMKRGPVLGRSVAFLRTPASRDAADDRLDRSMEVNEE